MYNLKRSIIFLNVREIFIESDYSINSVNQCKIWHQNSVHSLNLLFSAFNKQGILFKMWYIIDAMLFLVLTLI